MSEIFEKLTDFERELLEGIKKNAKDVLNFTLNALNSYLFVMMKFENKI